jgi:hypothetical protein
MQFLSIPNLALALAMTSAASAACSLPFDKSYCCNNLFPIGSELLFLESYLNCKKKNLIIRTVHHSDFTQVRRSNQALVTQSNSMSGLTPS